MRSIRLYILAATLAGLSLSSLHAQDMPQWKKVGDWDIRIDTSLDNGCFMFGSYSSGTVFRVGFNRQSANGYLIIGNSAWASLAEGQTYPIEFQFGNETPWKGDATGIKVGSSIVLILSFTSPEMMQELADAQGLNIRYEGKQIAGLELTGSRAAVDELVRCQTEVDKVTTRAVDPFAARPRSPQSDPFKR